MQTARACHRTGPDTSLLPVQTFAPLLEGVKVAAMETCGRDAAVTYPGRAEERDYEPEHLPPLLEDEVSEAQPGVSVNKLNVSTVFTNALSSSESMLLLQTVEVFRYGGFFFLSGGLELVEYLHFSCIKAEKL